jgi:uncharacterized protein YjiS (DUF1127 family)
MSTEKQAKTAERYRQRKQLMEMDYRQLKDIGITPEEAQQEARKPIWKDLQMIACLESGSGRCAKK